jgi:hypothetical protein
MGFSSFPENLAVIDGFHKLLRKSSCYRWVSQASQENPAVIDGFHKLPRKIQLLSPQALKLFIIN